MRLLRIVLIFLITGTVCLQAGAAQSVRVSGNQLLLDGKPFIAKGAIVRAFLDDGKSIADCSARERYCDVQAEARDFYFGRGQYKGQSSLDVAQSWQMNTIRFNISQAELAPLHPSYSPEYLDELNSAVALARSRGFVVVLALFTQRNKNAPEALEADNLPSPLDDATTVEAATTLGRKFGRDTGVMIEALNEPFSPGPRKKGWLIWRDGGQPTRGRFVNRRFVGVNAVIKAVRDAGGKNVIILQGLGASFRGFPGGLRDPLNQLAFSVHPFLGDGSPAHVNWDERFGDFAKRNPVLITAWGARARPDNWCGTAGLTLPVKFLSYLKQRKIGLIVFALDVPKTLLVNFRDSRSEVRQFGKTCNGGGAGQLVKEYFSGNLAPITP